MSLFFLSGSELPLGLCTDGRWVRDVGSISLVLHFQETVNFSRVAVQQFWWCFLARPSDSDAAVCMAELRLAQAHSVFRVLLLGCLLGVRETFCKFPAVTCQGIRGLTGGIVFWCKSGFLAGILRGLDDGLSNTEFCTRHVGPVDRWLSIGCIHDVLCLYFQLEYGIGDDQFVLSTEW